MYRTRIHNIFDSHCWSPMKLFTSPPAPSLIPPPPITDRGCEIRFLWQTYHALKRLEKARPELGGGLYCGPLRLLALEVYDKLNREAGVPTSLLTGQEKREVPGASHVSCTLEMANLNQEYDVVVIDEIQMIADKQRGYAW